MAKELEKKPAKAAEKSKDSSELPKAIGPYAIYASLGRGSSSQLYLAADPESDRLVTLKVLHPKYVDKGDAVKRFLRESAILKKLDHPNIIKRYAQGRWEAGFYIAMEYVEGTPLRQYLLKNALSLPQALKIILKVAQAVDHMHKQHVIHRDLKPENILMTKGGDVKVIDLGIAFRTDERHGPEDYQVSGTPTYMSPEQRNNPTEINDTTDIYSLGILSYELALGRLSQGKIHLSLLPKGLQPILAKALQPVPTQRHKNANAFAHEISHYMQSPIFARERKREDEHRRLAERLRLAQQNCQEPIPEDWSRVRIATASHCAINQAAVAHCFLDMPAGIKGIASIEAPTTGPQGMFDLQFLMGILRTITPLSSDIVKIVQLANELVYNDPSRKGFRMSLLTLDTSANKLQYISCGQNPLWVYHPTHQLPMQEGQLHPLLGVEPEPTYLPLKHSWTPGDTLFLLSRKLHVANPEPKERSISPLQEKQILKELRDSTYLAFPNRAQILFRKLCPAPSATTELPSSSLMIIERTK